MFSKSKPTESVPQPSAPPPAPGLSDDWSPAAPPAVASIPTTTPAPQRKAAPSILSTDLTITGNVRSQGDIQVEGTVEGDIRAAHLTVGETATIRGEVVADEVVVNGRVVGRLRGLKVHLTSSARVEGDIVHKTIAIESGAHFEGSVQRQDDPVGSNSASSGPARLTGPREPLREAKKESSATPEPAAS
jgi:cytoskeletal protein CcmA (bactofilin family)